MSAVHLQRDSIHVLKLTEGSCDEDENDEPGTLEVTLSASGEAAVKAAAHVTARPLQARWGGCEYRWHALTSETLTAPCHLWLHLSDGHQATDRIRERAPSKAVFVDVARLKFLGHHPDVTFEMLQARLARDLVDINFLPGHVCVDFADVAAILVRATTVIQATGSEGSDAGEALTAALTGVRTQDATCALLIVAFPPGGGKLAQSKQAMTQLRSALNSRATFIYATTQDPKLTRGCVRLTVLSDFAAS